MEQSIEIMAGISFLALGLSYLLRTQDWVVWLGSLQRQGRSMSLTTGAISILIGSFIIGFHWNWKGWAMILTIIGVLATIKGFIRLLFPGCLPAVLARFSAHMNPILRFSGLVLVLLALGILYPVWQGG